MDDITLTAAINGGYVMRHQIIDLGYTDAAVHAAVRAGFLVRLRHGTYAPAATWRNLSDSQRHRVLTFSILDKLGPHVAASHQSAAALHGYDLYGVDLGTVHVTRLDGRTGRTEAGIVHHQGRVDPSQDVTLVEGRLAIAPMRTVIEACSVTSSESGLVLASSALRTQQFTKEELREAGEHYTHWLGTRRARLVFRLADGRLETVGEARSMHMFWRHRVPFPELQYVVVDVAGVEIARTDFAWVAYRHVGEFDGLVKYGRLNPYSNDLGRVLVDEKVREDLVRDQEFGMSRWVWSRLAPRAQARTAAYITAGMERSRRLYLRNGVHIPLG